MRRKTIALSAVAIVLAAVFTYAFVQHRLDRDHRAILSEARREWDDLVW